MNLQKAFVWGSWCIWSPCWQSCGHPHPARWWGTHGPVPCCFLCVLRYMSYVPIKHTNRKAETRRASQRALAFPCSFLITATGHKVGGVTFWDDAVEPDPIQLVCWFANVCYWPLQLQDLIFINIMSLKLIKTPVKLDLLPQKQRIVSQPPFFKFLLL